MAAPFRALDRTVRSREDTRTDLPVQIRGLLPMSSTGTANYLSLDEFMHRTGRGGKVPTCRASCALSILGQFITS